MATGWAFASGLALGFMGFVVILITVETFNDTEVELRKCIETIQLISTDIDKSRSLCVEKVLKPREKK